jgi:cardiolipin synthase (CMP-forming)
VYLAQHAGRGKVLRGCPSVHPTESQSGTPAFNEFLSNSEQYSQPDYVGKDADEIDGFIAKRFDLRSELGAYLDPLADKALLISIYVSLAIYAGLPAWLAIAVVSRDVMILVAVMVSWLMDKPVEIRPVWESKINTAAQIGLAGFALGARAYGVSVQPVQTVLEWTVAATTLVSGGVYIAQWLDHMSR